MRGDTSSPPKESERVRAQGGGAGPEQGLEGTTEVRPGAFV